MAERLIWFGTHSEGKTPQKLVGGVFKWPERPPKNPVPHQALGLNRLQLWKILPLVVMAAGVGWKPLSPWGTTGLRF